MQLTAQTIDQTTRHRHATGKGFTLIEVMIVVAIIGILATIALPSYRDYILRGQLVDATNLLSAGRANMERYFQDNRTYAPSGANKPPCDPTLPSGPRTQGAFVLSCPTTPTGVAYSISAVGTGSVSAFSYTVNEVDARTTVITSGPSGWTGGSSCWIVKKGQTC